MYGRRMIRREWYNTEDQRHRTTGPAVENWTVLPGGARVLSYQGWFLNGKVHRVDRPAVCRWHVAGDGTRVLVWEVWLRHGGGHRGRGPSYRHWTVEPDGTRRLASESWCVNGKLHRVDGPAFDRREFWWHGNDVEREDLPWLRRGRDLLVGLHAWTSSATKARAGARLGSVTPEWRWPELPRCRRRRTAVSPAPYRSVVGGVLLMCV